VSKIKSVAARKKHLSEIVKTKEKRITKRITFSLYVAYTMLVFVRVEFFLL